VLAPEAFDLGAQPLGENDGLVDRRVGEHDHELLAAEASDDVGRAGRLRDDARQHAQHVVAREVAAGVVERLEVVDVEQEQRERRARAASAADLLLEQAHREPAVVDAGQEVAFGLLAVRLDTLRVGVGDQREADRIDAQLQREALAHAEAARIVDQQQQRRSLAAAARPEDEEVAVPVAIARAHASSSRAPERPRPDAPARARRRPQARRLVGGIESRSEGSSGRFGAIRAARRLDVSAAAFVADDDPRARDAGRAEGGAHEPLRRRDRVRGNGDVASGERGRDQRGAAVHVRRPAPRGSAGGWFECSRHSFLRDSARGSEGLIGRMCCASDANFFLPGRPIMVRLPSPERPDE
jgi:hypothetical protein